MGCSPMPTRRLWAKGPTICFASTGRSGPRRSWRRRRGSLDSPRVGTAVELASRAFSPVPVAATCPHDARPRDAVLILDGQVRHAMGLEDAERLFLTP